MQIEVNGQTPKMRIAGLVLSGLVALFLLMDAGMKLALVQPVVDTSIAIGWPVAVAPTLGALLLALVALYLWPRTAILGAVLLTGYLGGAVAAHVRIGSPLFSHVLFGVYLGILLWGGLWFRLPELRALLPLRKGGVA